MPDPIDPELLYIPFLVNLFGQFEEFYFRKHLFEKDKLKRLKFNSRGIADVVLEAMKNASHHGAKNKQPYHVGLFFGNKGICYGFQDGGDYFKRPEVKHDLERKISRLKKDKRTTDTPGYGVNMLFENTDRIEVDNDLGVLYCVQLLKRIVLPKPK